MGIVARELGIAARDARLGLGFVHRKSQRRKLDQWECGGSGLWVCSG